MQAPVIHILPLTTIRRECTLPVPGRIIAKLDQKVTALDVVAEANYGREHALIDVGRALGLAAEAADAAMLVKAGDLVSAGDPLAQRPGLTKQAVRAPHAGRIVVIGGGKLLMELGEENFELRASIPGTVTRHIAEKGVEITFTGALVQGVWGNGKTDQGMLLAMITSPEDLFSAKSMDVSQRGSILLAGYCSDPSALHAAADLPVRGLILGSIAPALLPLASQAAYPIIVVDGFGPRPFDSAAYKLLTTNEKRETTLNAQAFDLQSGVRPEIYIPLPVSQEPAPPRGVGTFAPEQPVRLLRSPHASQVGVLISLKPGLTTMPSGLRVPAAQVRLDTGEQVIVPLANLEVLG
jgi:hypothetical protein